MSTERVNQWLQDIQLQLAKSVDDKGLIPSQPTIRQEHGNDAAGGIFQLLHLPRIGLWMEVTIQDPNPQAGALTEIYHSLKDNTPEGVYLATETVNDRNAAIKSLTLKGFVKDMVPALNEQFDLELEIPQHLRLNVVAPRVAEFAGRG